MLIVQIEMSCEYKIHTRFYKLGMKKKDVRQLINKFFFFFFSSQSLTNFYTGCILKYFECIESNNILIKYY